MTDAIERRDFVRGAVMVAGATAAAALSQPASAKASGVLPAPPRVGLPTQTTGTATRAPRPARRMVAAAP